MKPLIIIPARKGSKGVPLKNFRELPDGTTLLSRAVAVGMKCDGDVVISTDAPELCEDVAKFWGSRLRIHPRPQELSGDTTTMHDVIADVLQTFKNDLGQECVVLQPTVPLREVDRVLDCLTAMRRNGKPTATVSPVPEKYWRMRVLFGDGTLKLPDRRQLAYESYIFSGDAYCFTRGYGFTQAWHPYIVQESLNIDTLADFERLCALIRPRQTDASTPEP